MFVCISFKCLCVHVGLIQPLAARNNKRCSCYPAVRHCCRRPLRHCTATTLLTSMLSRVSRTYKARFRPSAWQFTRKTHLHRQNRPVADRHGVKGRTQQADNHPPQHSAEVTETRAGREFRTDASPLVVCIDITLSANFVSTIRTASNEQTWGPTFESFYRAMLCIRGTSHGPVSVHPSVCLSVRPSQVGVLLKRLNVGSHKQHHTIAQGL